MTIIIDQWWWWLSSLSPSMMMIEKTKCLKFLLCFCFVSLFSLMIMIKIKVFVFYFGQNKKKFPENNHHHQYDDDFIRFFLFPEKFFYFSILKFNGHENHLFWWKKRPHQNFDSKHFRFDESSLAFCFYFVLFCCLICWLESILRNKKKNYFHPVSQPTLNVFSLNGCALFLFYVFFFHIKIQNSFDKMMKTKRRQASE